MGIRSLTKDCLIKQEQQVTLNSEIVVAIAGAAIGWIVWVFAILPFTALKNTYAGHLVIPFFFCIVVSTLAWFFSLSWIRSRKSDRIAQIHLDHGLCPSCAYALAGLQPQSDGRVVCPECNAAWNADRVSARDV